MKNVLRLTMLFLSGAMALSLTGCLQDECEATSTFVTFEPIYQTAAQIRQPITVEGPRVLENPGKIYVYGDYILVNEIREGIHIIDNKDPRNPVNISFINIPGNVDMVVRNNFLYADNYIDLITMDVRDPANPQMVSRTEDVFPSLGFDQTRGHLVFFREVQRTQEAPCNVPDGGWFWRDDQVLVNAEAVNAFADANGARATANGIGGSMARFTLVDQYLYTVDDFNLRVFDLASATNPRLANTVNIGWGIETIFPYGENLFIGSQTGMFIFDNKNRTAPTMMSVFQHARACDPVFVEGNLAYVTLRDGTTCENFTNQLDIVDVSDLFNPKLLKTHRMHRPHGLSVVDQTVYLCDDDQGLKVFDASDWNDLRTLSHLSYFTTYDVIALPDVNRAIVVGRDGLYQFDIANPAKLQELSFIPVTKQ